ncbi:MAG: zinc ribbon domain-containing protein [Planctomycetota bacterium]
MTRRALIPIIITLAAFIAQSFIAMYATLNPRKQLPALPTSLVFDPQTDFVCIAEGTTSFTMYADEAPLRTTRLLFRVDFATEPEAQSYADSLNDLIGEVDEVSGGTANLGVAPLSTLPAPFDFADLATGGPPEIDSGCDVVIVAGGWPMRSWAGYAYEPTPDAPREYGSVLIAPAKVPAAWQSNRDPAQLAIGTDAMIPAAFLPLGNVVNTSVIALPAIGIYFLARAMRKLRRTKRGRCTSCGYQLLPEQSLCPECGHQMPALAAEVS